MYVNDYDDFLLPIENDAPGLDRRTWVFLLRNYINESQMPDDYWAEFKQKGILVCPSFKAREFSQWYPHYGLADGPSKGGAGGWWFPGVGTLYGYVKISQVTYPSEKCVFTDSYDSTSGEERGMYWVNPNQASYVAFRHAGGRTNVAFVDGHVATLPRDEIYTTYPEWRTSKFWGWGQ